MLTSTGLAPAPAGSDAQLPLIRALLLWRPFRTQSSSSDSMDAWRAATAMR